VWISFRLTAFLPTTRGTTLVEKPTLRLIAAMSVTGVRGAITLAGVLSLPLALADGTAFPTRDLAIFLAASVVIVSRTVASVTLPRLLRSLGPDSEPTHETEIDLARSDAAAAAIRAIEETSHTLASGQSDADLHAEAAARVMDLYRRALRDRPQVRTLLASVAAMISNDSCGWPACAPSATSYSRVPAPMPCPTRIAENWCERLTFWKSACADEKT
jgi:CPA1 family monovalent cation:H+ antiporter